jgi:hypothetical protein
MGVRDTLDMNEVNNKKQEDNNTRKVEKVRQDGDMGEFSLNTVHFCNNDTRNLSRTFGTTRKRK